MISYLRKYQAFVPIIALLFALTAHSTAFAALFDDLDSSQNTAETREIRVIQAIDKFEVLMDYLAHRSSHFQKPTDAASSLRVIDELSEIFLKLSSLSENKLLIQNNQNYEFEQFSIVSLNSQLSQAIAVLRTQDLQGKVGSSVIVSEIKISHAFGKFITHLYNQNSIGLILCERVNWISYFFYGLFKKYKGVMDTSALKEISLLVSKKFSIPFLYVFEQAKIEVTKNSVYHKDHGRIYNGSFAVDLILMTLTARFFEKVQPLAALAFNSKLAITPSQIQSTGIVNMIEEIFSQQSGVASLIKMNFLEMIANPQMDLVLHEANPSLDPKELMKFDWGKTNVREGIGQAITLISNLGLGYFSESHLIYGAVITKHSALTDFLEQVLRKKIERLSTQVESEMVQVTRLDTMVSLSKKTLDQKQRATLVKIGLELMDAMNPASINVLNDMKEIISFWNNNYPDLYVGLMDTRVPALLSKLGKIEDRMQAREKSVLTKISRWWSGEALPLEVRPLALLPFAETHGVCQSLFKN